MRRRPHLPRCLTTSSQRTPGPIAFFSSDYEDAGKSTGKGKGEADPNLRWNDGAEMQ